MDNNMIVMLTLVICIAIYVTADTNLLGDDTDKHGCKASAGYSWCAAQNKCIPAWDDCTAEMPGSDVDEHGCKASAGQSWCESKNKCIRSWEEDCPAVMPGSDSNEHGCSPSQGWCHTFKQCVPLDEVDLCNNTLPPDPLEDNESADTEDPKDTADTEDTADAADTTPENNTAHKITKSQLNQLRIDLGLHNN